MSNGLEVWNGLAHSGNAKHLEWLQCSHLETDNWENSMKVESVMGEDMGPAGSFKELRHQLRAVRSQGWVLSRE